jgi:predicted metalloendopeptidase
MLGLRYVAGAIPGKSLKRKTTESDDKQNKRKKYEENRKARKFNVKWLTNREWLDYDESNDIMTCKTVLTYMNIQKNNILHLNCIHFFSSSKK